MFRALADLQKSGIASIDLSCDASADLVVEFKQWLSITATSQEGPRQRARHVTAALKTGASDALSVALGGVVRTVAGAFSAGWVFPEDWLSKYINQKEMYALYYLLRQFCARFPDVLRRAQVFVDVDNQSVVGAFNRGRARNREQHALLVQLFELQVEYDFMLSLRWVPTEETGVADAISRPSREATIRISPAAFELVLSELGPSTVDLMACTASAPRPPGVQEPLPFFSRHDCPGSTDVNVCFGHAEGYRPGLWLLFRPPQ